MGRPEEKIKWEKYLQYKLWIIGKRLLDAETVEIVKTWRVFLI
jgi:hypothetical protein